MDDMKKEMELMKRNVNEIGNGKLKKNEKNKLKTRSTIIMF